MPASPGVYTYGNVALGQVSWLNQGKIATKNANYAALGCTNEECNTKDWVFNANYRYVGLFHFFHLLWNIQFFFYFGYLVSAGTIAYWYFSPRNGKGKHTLNHTPVLHSVGRTCRYHLGSVAFGSLIIAIVQLIRFISTLCRKSLCCIPIHFASFPIRLL
jgi:hypothetical protein